MDRILKVISGGQTGVDQGALAAAKEEGFPTGGTMPQGCVTLEGQRHEFKLMYGMVEHSSPQYPPRTYQNVKDGDVTIRIARDFNSAGELLTLKAIAQYEKRHKDINLDDPEDPQAVAQWLVDSGAQVVNVAGNSERIAPGAFKKSKAFLVQVFQHYKTLTTRVEPLVDVDIVSVDEEEEIPLDGPESAVEELDTEDQDECGSGDESKQDE
jgi:hypothetical protein